MPMDATKKYDSVDAYIAAQEAAIQPLLSEIREIIRSTVPNAIEVISYGMPAYKVHGVLVYFAANKKHIGFYPTASPIVVFAEELQPYKTSKGAIQFPVETRIPADLVRKITQYRLEEDEVQFALKKRK
jgi:uncharacterized protein YdhG (YjbR/CyaY superfamily)